MTASPMHLDTRAATQIVRDHLDAKLNVVAVRRRHTGPVNVVYEWHTDGEPADLIAKICDQPNDLGLHHEMAALQWYRRHTRVPAPQPYACVTDLHTATGADSAVSQTCLLMQYLPGRNLTEARLSPAGVESFQTQLAHCLLELHRHQRDTYGDELSAGTTTRWLDRFQPAMAQYFTDVRDRLSARSQWAVGELIEKLDQWLPEFNQPTLIHGDLWTNNILVDDHKPDQPKLSGLIDCGVNFSEVEYELAYLLAFKTVNQTFFDVYTKKNPLRSGFDRRCKVYWLHTAMRHATTYGAAYLKDCERIVDELHRYL